MENKFAKKISLTIPESVSKHMPHVKIPEFNMPEINVPKVTIPEEARRPFYATVGAAEVAVERVRGAVATMQVRAVDTQKNLSDKATEKLNDSAASASKAASSAYAEFTRRGEETLGRIWPDAVAKTETPAKPTSSKATTKTTPKKRTSPKSAPKATTTKVAARKGPATKAATSKVAAPKATAPKAAAPKAAPKPAEAKAPETKTPETKTADKPASE